MRNSKLTVITDVLLIIYSFILVIISLLSDKYLTGYKQSVNKLFFNFRFEPLKDIHEFRWNCSKDYHALFIGSYNGNSEGCYKRSEHILYYHKCNFTKFETDEDYQKIPEINETNLYIWRNKFICGKRYKSDELNKSYITEKDECPEGFRMCAYADLYKNKMCVINNQDCPITHISIRDINTVKSSNYKYISLDDSKELVYSRHEKESYIPIDFKISQNIPCIESDRISNTSEAFPLTKNLDKYGCLSKNKNNSNYSDYLNYLDKRYILLDTMMEKDYLYNNDLEDILKFPELSYWKKNYTNNINLYYRTTIKMNYECSSYKDNIYFTDIVEEGKIYQFSQIVLSLANLIIICVFVSLLSILKIGNKNQNILIGFIKILLLYAFIITNTYISTLIKRDSEFINEKISFFLKNKCLDETSIFSFYNIYKADTLLDNWKIFNSYNFWSSFPYGLLILINSTKYIYKTYLRIRNRKRNIEAQNELKTIIN